MATNTNYIVVGAAVPSIGAYVAAGGAGSLTDVGHLKNPTTLQAAFEDYPVTSERAQGALKKVPQSSSYKLKLSMTESLLANLQKALRQPSANLTNGDAAIEEGTLLVGNAAEQYHQIQLVGVGPGATAVRTVTLWRCIVESVAEMAFAKGAEIMYEVTFDVLHDDSVATADKFFKIVDA